MPIPTALLPIQFLPAYAWGFAMYPTLQGLAVTAATLSRQPATCPSVADVAVGCMSDRFLGIAVTPAHVSPLSALSSSRRSREKRPEE